jgi:hypothetical protein
MNNQPLIFEEILRGDLRPWLDENKIDEKFVPIISDIATVKEEFDPIYEFDFYRFFNSRTRYYHKLITNEANRYCNQIIAEIGAETDTRVIKYKLGDTLKKKFRTLFRDVAKLIKAKDYDLVYINPHKINPSVDTDHKTEAYTIQLLKTALVKVYLETQAAYKAYIPDYYMEIEDLYLQFLSESIPEHTFLKPITQITDIDIVAVNTVSVPETKTAKSKAKTFKYNQLATNSEAFKDLLDSMKLNKLVDKKTTIHDLKKIFSGVDDFKPLVWSGNISDLYYFIILLHNEYKLVESISPYHWQVTCNCFIKPDGTSFGTTQLKTQQKPKLNAEMIEKVASLLK